MRCLRIGRSKRGCVRSVRAQWVSGPQGGAQRLDVRFIQFDNVVIELLQYRDAEQRAIQMHFGEHHEAS